MFMGQYRHNIDAKGRIIIPSRYRDELGKTVVVTKWFDGCLSVFTFDKWENIYQQITALPNTMKESRMYVRTMMSNAIECELDSQGRILLTPSLIKEANISKECIFVGAGDHVELWDSTRWDNFINDADSSFETIAEKLTEFMK